MPFLYNFIFQIPKQNQTFKSLPSIIHCQFYSLDSEKASKFPFKMINRACIFDYTIAKFPFIFTMLHKNMYILENCISVTKQGRMPFTYSILWEHVSKIKYRLEFLDRNITYWPSIQPMEGNLPDFLKHRVRDWRGGKHLDNHQGSPNLMVWMTSGWTLPKSSRSPGLDSHSRVLWQPHKIHQIK